MRTHTLIHRPQRGFTLLELLVVLLIIALLAGYVGPKMFDRLELAKVQTAQGQMKSLGDAMNQYRLDNGNYPDETLGLNALVTRPANAPHWQGPYVKTLPLDPWGNPYLYKYHGVPPNDADIISLGRDGKAGGENTYADIVYGL
ncbi:type II secretion system protein GspG [Pseudomonas fluorescens]|uniref:Type II secretion system core protein G n=1 Tax=Pseudomonas lactucae TaxID=2813360 RepID=A0A9X1C3J5_9PSED|nr:type II secretion system major pseudopilin GspG [Pseudomonas lactucae]OPA83190.1 type II secretion system protein GspG [Pseudomonas fluorescens]MBN2975381.1 type II secretion system major pseudopilin GspG [Pseudomonas lactucae]MBN2989712.1 type II secretion system major pseudopilin GspG [Pseudomonas lactucae]OPB04064.1 type II secretion system protein GspG [Pseudomonas fluorescens]OPB15363.1 type II secretion system protein GspG [Pseudomonas fluorescens]